MDSAKMKDVDYSVFDDERTFKVVGKKCHMDLKKIEKKNLQLFIIKKESVLSELCLSETNCTLGRIGPRGLSIYHMGTTHLLTFPTEECFFNAQRRIQAFLLGDVPQELTNGSVFKKRTLEWSAVQYFQFYSYLSQQQNMMQDYIRTSTYQRAVFANTIDFRDKVVLDVGAGSGILSFFAVQGGARKVYAVEASNMAQHCQNLVRSNKMTKKITVIEGKIEEVSLPEKVDLIVSEPMGYMLVNERMLETYIHARKFLKPGGRMFPTFADLYIAPFTDDALYQEQFTKANFWYQPSFHGVDLTGLRDVSLKEYFTQPVVDTFDVGICMAPPCKYTVNFLKASEDELSSIEVDLEFVTTQAGTIHGLAFWFDVCFEGSQTKVWLSTSPTEPLTHWYQVRCLLTSPLFVQEGQCITGSLHMYANAKQSYDVEIRLEDDEMNRVSNRLDLKNPCFRYTGANYSSTQTQMNSTTSPTEAYFDTNMSNCSSAPNTTPTSNGLDQFPQLPSRMQPSNQNGPQMGAGSCLGTAQPAVSPQFMIGDYAAAAGGGIPSGSQHPSGACQSSSASTVSASGLVPHAAGVSIQPTTRGFHSVHLPSSTAPMPY